MRFLRHNRHVIILGGIIFLTVILGTLMFLNRKNDKPKKTFVEEIVVTPTSYVKIAF